MKTIEKLIELKEHTAIVTGSGSGIGRAIATRLHEAGANLVLVDIDNEAIRELEKEFCERRVDSAIAVEGDVSVAETVLSARDHALEKFGRIDILINNAGIFPNQPLSEMEEGDFDRVMAINLKSVFLSTKYISETMIKRGSGGRIINITSIDALHPSMVGLAHYDASKHGVWGFTKNVALELADHNIAVNAVAPGGVATPGVAALSAGNEAPDIEGFIQTIPMKRMGEPDDIAKTVLFLSSELSSYTTGSQIVVDGGKLLT